MTSEVSIAIKTTQTTINEYCNEKLGIWRWMIKKPEIIKTRCGELLSFENEYNYSKGQIC